MTPRPRVKVCGITRPEDGAACLAAGADLLGVLFAESPRKVSPARARAIRAALPSATLVGVFVDPSPEEAADRVRACGLDRVQLHGDETPEACAAIRAAAGVPVMKAFRLGPRPAPAPEALAACGAEYVLLDLEKGLPPEARGAAAAALLEAGRRAAEAGLRVFVAGGLTPENVGDAVRRARPYGVDVSRGVEAAPGIKDPAAVERFVAEVRACSRDET